MQNPRVERWRETFQAPQPPSVALGNDDELAPFEPAQKIIEYQVAPPYGELAQMSLVQFANATSTDSPAPGGGSVAAAAGAFGAALNAMVANLTIGKKGYEAVFETLKPLAELAQNYRKEFLQAIDRDTAAFNRLMQVFALPKKSEAQKKERTQAIESATKAAVEVPLSVMRFGVEMLEKALTIARTGNKNALSDVGVGALMLRAATEGAFLNVKINLPGIKDKAFTDISWREAEKLLSLAKIAEKKILDVVEKRMNGGED